MNMELGSSITLNNMFHKNDNLVNLAKGTAEPDKKNDEIPKSLGMCARLAYGTANCVKRFGLGVAAGAAIITPVSQGISYLAQLGGFIPTITKEDNIRSMVENMQKKGFDKFNVDRLLNATCSVEEYTSQFNSHNRFDGQHLTPLIFKITNVAKMGVIGPIQEEIIFRGLIQDVLLTRIPKYVIKKIAPGKEIILDSKIAKAARILLTSLAFSAIHLGNKGMFSDSYIRAQLIGTFVGGIGYGALKESKAGLIGAIGAHIAHNIIALAPMLWGC